MRWVGPGEWTVEYVVLLGERPFLRVKQHGYIVRECRSVAEVASLVDLADLVEVTELRPARSKSR
ncbi:transposase [Spongiactinospora gelatinilytica]|uniref:Transposase n=1 Tax=Spongiactinospora gelatinilytica TaxID=2666298 RepID=A0A2W2G2P1_9ACTN|nr:transposase [Spongiactinospora gelatinilytica]PZG28427.1 transposase [Spongiactinospora gelatinilytica]